MHAHYLFHLVRTQLKKFMHNGYRKEKNCPIWEFFTVAEDSRLGKCKVCEMEVPCGGQSIKSFTTTNLVHHIKTKHDEEYARYNRLKADSDGKQKELGSTSDSEGMRLRQVSL